MGCDCGNPQLRRGATPERGESGSEPGGERWGPLRLAYWPSTLGRPLGPAGQDLLPTGLLLAATGEEIGSQTPDCASALLASLPITGIDMEAFEPTEGPWIGDDLRSWTDTGSRSRRQRPTLKQLVAGAARGERMPTSDAEPGGTDLDPPEQEEDRRDAGSAPGSQGGVLSGGCDDGDVIIDPDDLPTLSGRCSITLGTFGSGSGAIELTATVPAGYEPSRSRGEMKRALLGDWLDWCVPAGEADWAQADRCILWTSNNRPGLFWDDGHGYYFKALLHAVRTVHGFAAYTKSLPSIASKCGYSAGSIRDKIETGRDWLVSANGICTASSPTIQVTTDGRVQVAFPGGDPLIDHGAFAVAGNVYMCANNYKWRAALADYLLWWAWRLYGYALDESRSYHDMLVAQMCAVTAMAEITAIARLIVHELGHLFGSPYHCREDDLLGLLGSAFFGAVFDREVLGPIESVVEALIAGKLYCCQDVCAGAFQARVQATLGLPSALYHGTGVTRDGMDRFESYGQEKQDGWKPGNRCGKDGNPVWWTVRESLVPGSALDLSWRIPESCGDAPDRTGSVVFR